MTDGLTDKMRREVAEIMLEVIGASFTSFPIHNDAAHACMLLRNIVDSKDTDERMPDSALSSFFDEWNKTRFTLDRTEQQAKLALAAFLRGLANDLERGL